VSIEVKGVSKRFGDFNALNAVDLTVEPGELLALLGPSGSGKTTLLRIIAGLEFADAGQILLNGQDTSRTPVGQRRVGFVFQHYALFRHMSVFENVAFGLRVRPRAERPTESKIRESVLRYLDMVQIADLADRSPSQISGGQRQRVALARALAIEPQMLLLDEPFGALDAKVRKDLRRWLRHLHEETGVTTIFVTHDQDEALELADRVAVMNNAVIEQVGTPDDVFRKPATPFVAGFIGDTNTVPCLVRNGQVMIWGRVFHVSRDAADGDATGYVRPHEVEILTAESKGAVPATVRHVVTTGSVARVTVSAAGAAETIEAQVSLEEEGHLNLSTGSRVFVRPRSVRIFLKHATSNRHIAAVAA